MNDNAEEVRRRAYSLLASFDVFFSAVSCSLMMKSSCQR